MKEGGHDATVIMNVICAISIQIRSTSQSNDMCHNTQSTKRDSVQLPEWQGAGTKESIGRLHFPVDVVLPEQGILVVLMGWLKLQASWITPDSRKVPGINMQSKQLSKQTQLASEKCGAGHSKSQLCMCSLDFRTQLDLEESNVTFILYLNVQGVMYGTLLLPPLTYDPEHRGGKEC